MCNCLTVGIGKLNFLRSENMAEQNVGKIVQVIGAVLDIKFSGAYACP